jgi:ubiquinone/menaquinone biosynthesis C-methylase UbiE
MGNAPSYDGYRKYTADVASNYERDRQVEAHWWKEDEFVREYFRDRVAPRLLDIPVGTGRFLPHYTRAQQVIGVDVSADMLDEARRKLALLPAGTAGSVERGDVFSLRFGDREFTHAVVWRLFHLIPEDLIPGAIAELCRVTDGEVVLQTYVAGPAAPADPVSPRSRLATGLRRVARSVRGIVAPAPRMGAATSTATEEVSAAVATPWSHIQSYSHSQARIDALFLGHGFAARIARHLDTYDNCDVRVTVYQR